jgi:hypothetical protein
MSINMRYHSQTHIGGLSLNQPPVHRVCMLGTSEVRHLVPSRNKICLTGKLAIVGSGVEAPHHPCMEPQNEVTSKVRFCIMIGCDSISGTPVGVWYDHMTFNTCGPNTLSTPSLDKSARKRRVSGLVARGTRGGGKSWKRPPFPPSVR